MNPSESLPTPTDTRRAVDRELHLWSRIYSGDGYYYGDEPGPMARRAVRYHRPWFRPGATALDLGCGEGQDLAYLAELGYSATGVEFTPEGAAKARRLLSNRGVAGAVVEEDLRSWEPARPYDLVLAVNALQFLGADAPAIVDRLAHWVAPGGVLGLSLFARDEGEAPQEHSVRFFTVDEVLDRFAGWQRLEAAHLWQWNVSNNEPQPFVTLIARKAPPAGRPVIRVPRQTVRG